MTVSDHGLTSNCIETFTVREASTAVDHHTSAVSRLSPAVQDQGHSALSRTEIRPAPVC